MRRGWRMWVLPVFLAMGAVGGPALAQAAADQPAKGARPRDPTLGERLYIASTAYHAVKRYFAHAEGLPADYDFEAHYRDYLRETVEATDRKAFSRASMRFFASLGNGHTSFQDDTVWDGFRRPPFAMMPVEGRWTITRSRHAALSPGDVVETVDGIPVAEWLVPVMAHVGQSNRAASDRMVWGYRFLMPERFALELAGGRRVPIDMRAPVADTARGPSVPEEVTVVRRPDGVTVIRIPGFGEPKHEAAAIAAVRSAGDARAILIDLRGNGGGSTPSDLLAAIMTAPYRGTQFVTPTTIAVNDARASFGDGNPALPSQMMRFGPDTTQPRKDAWPGKIGLLVDGSCASACEDFALRFKDGKRGLVLGEPTFGSTGQPYFVDFNQFGMSFRVSTKREYLPDGSPFEGVGVAPDRAVPLTRAELARGVDAQLARATQILLAR